MQDRKVSLSCVWAGVAWAGSILLMLSGTVAAFVADTYAPAFALLSHALLVSAIAAVLTIRVFFEHHRQQVQNAFAIGRDVGDNIRKFRS